MPSKNFLQYLYWLSKSDTFNEKATEIKQAIFERSGADGTPKKLFEALAEKYEIPKQPKEYKKLFNSLVLGESLNNIETHGIDEDANKNIKVQGPAIILVIKKLQTRGEFIALWEHVKTLQTGRLKTHGKEKVCDIIKLFGDQKRWKGKMAFDEVFHWYKLRKKLSWEAVHKKVRQEQERRRATDKDTIRIAVERLEKIINHL